MGKIFLFDWGDTIMRDFPDEKGSMYLWTKVEMMPNADIMLRKLSTMAPCYLATNAKDSTKEEIDKALERVNLHSYFTDIFCYRELGVSKPSKEYFDIIIEKLEAKKENIVLVGDNLEKDVLGALEFGIQAVLYDPLSIHSGYKGLKIYDLKELLTIFY